MSSEGHYCNYDFGGSDYLSPAEEERYLEQARKRAEEQVKIVTTMTPEQEQVLKNAEHRADFLQDLANSHEQGMLERQGKIEVLEKERDVLLCTVAELKSEVRDLKRDLRNLDHQKTARKEVLDYRRVDPDLINDLAAAYLEYGPGDEVDGIERDIREQATFHPHVQQEIIRDGHGVLRFRKNDLIDRLVTEAGKDSRLMGLSYIATLEASIEDRAQLAQLIGYSVDGYHGLSYSLPIEEDKIPVK